jgi:hypothetical protein
MAPRIEARGQATGIDLTCPSCGATVHLDHAGEVRNCPACRQPLTRTAQLGQLLERWYQPRRWRADLVKPSVAYLVERLWTANGQGERLYEGVSPKYANYDHFRYFVTRLMIQGIDDGWAELTFPDDPLAEDPQYELKIVDSDKFANGVEKLFPEVDWNEPIAAELAERLRAEAGEVEKPKGKAKKKKSRL